MVMQLKKNCKVYSNNFLKKALDEMLNLSYIKIYNMIKFHLQCGAISIIFLFILMLINIRISELQTNNLNYLPLAFFSVTILLIILTDLLPSSKNISINYVTSYGWENNLINNDQISSIGNVMYTNYAIWLIIVAIILLLAMVGSIVITIKGGNSK